MSQGPIPFRTYVIAGTLSVVVNIAAVGTFATARVGSVSFASTARMDADASATVVLTDWPEANQPPKTEDDAAPAAEPQNEIKAPLPTPAAPPPPPPPEPEVPRVRLGNTDAPESDSKVWLGVSKDAGTPKARPGTLDQAEFKKGTPGQPSEEESVATQAAPPKQSTTPAQPSTPQANTQASDMAMAKTPTIDTGAAQSDRATEHARSTVDEKLTVEDINEAAPGERTERGTARTDDPFKVTLDSARQATTRLSRQVIEALAKASQPKPQDVESTERTKALDLNEVAEKPVLASPMAPPSPAPTKNTARSGQNGIGADRESDAFSKERPVTIRPGQPLAGKGLSIKTVAPRWTTATRVLHRFRDPVVRVKFGRNGKVINASFAPGKDAGHPDVSGPLLDAIYRWTAQGEELNRIPEGDPLAGLVLEFHVSLH